MQHQSQNCLTKYSPRSEQPKDILKPLKPHQLAMLHKCKIIEQNSKFGIMTSLPGSGKTMILLSLIISDILSNKYCRCSTKYLLSMD
jgi:type II secretory pathway predicted ATPase ExeA